MSHGVGCPRCGGEPELGPWLRTTKAWQYYCKSCDVRFDKFGEVHE